LSREVSVSLADACFDEDRHADGEVPSGVKERLRLVVATEAAGGEFQKLRKAINSNIDLANAVQRDRSANGR